MTLPNGNSQGAGRVTWISPSRAAKLIGCSQRHVYDLVEEGELRGHQRRPGAWWKIDFQSVVDYIGRERNATCAEMGGNA